jgi:nitrite reductase/ring-hydroxylating ferredoxin subunit
MTDYTVGRIDEIPLGEGRAFAAGGERVAIFRLRDGAVRAVSAVCPHAGGPIADGQADLNVVVCPLHLHAFDLATGCSRSGQPDLRTYPVRIDDGWLVVTVPSLTPSV